MSNPRQLIVCCDGTNNNVTGGRTDTNVIKLQSGLARDAEQIVFYDPGVGNPGELPSATLVDKVRNKFQRLSGLAFGSGVYENIAECYTFLMLNYQKGDQIYLFGFSRGAFTARALSGVVNMFGLLRPELANMVPTLLYIYFSKRESDTQQLAARSEASDIQSLFVEPDHRDVWIHYIGVWDTVASIGMPPFDKQITGSPVIRGKKFHHVRQALALDEYRTPFLPRLYAESDFDHPPSATEPEQSLKQRWFHGAHSDVGGGYDPKPDGPQSGCGLSDGTLQWLYDEARSKGLRGSALVLPATITRVHSELYNEALWALAGMVQRSMEPTPGGANTIDLIGPVSALPANPANPANPATAATAAQPALSFPSDTVWSISRPVGSLIIAAVVCAAAMIVLAQLMIPASAAAAPHVSAWSDALRTLMSWQSTLQWTAADVMAAAIPHLKTALLFLLVAQGAALYILARWSSWSFAQIARLRDPQWPPSAALNKLGVAPRWFTVFTLGTTIAALISLLIGPWSWPWLAVTFRLAMNALWWLQWLALLGVAVLVGWGIWGRLRR